MHLLVHHRITIILLCTIFIKEPCLVSSSKKKESEVFAKSCLAAPQTYDSSEWYYGDEGGEGRLRERWASLPESLLIVQPAAQKVDKDFLPIDSSDTGHSQEHRKVRTTSDSAVSKDSLQASPSSSSPKDSESPKNPDCKIESTRKTYQSPLASTNSIAELKKHLNICSRKVSDGCFSNVYLGEKIVDALMTERPDGQEGTLQRKKVGPTKVQRYAIKEMDEVKYKDASSMATQEASILKFLTEVGYRHAPRFECIFSEEIQMPAVKESSALFERKSTRGIHYIVMEFIEGREMTEEIARIFEFRRRMPVRYLKYLAAQLVIILEDLHAFNIVYRDLKPENIKVMAGSGRLRLVDFGFAVKLKRPDERLRDFKGTLEFICPEIMRGLEYSFEADIWSLGITLYALALGNNVPFSGTSIKHKDCSFKPEKMKLVLANLHRRMIDELPHLNHFVDLVSGLLSPDATERLHFFQTIKQKQFFEGVKWSELRIRDIDYFSLCNIKG